MVDTQNLNVMIRSSDKILFDGEAKTVSSVNDTGPFDILPFHANFISIIKSKISVKLNNGSRQDFPIDGGVMQVHENKVEVFLGIEALTS